MTQNNIEELKELIGSNCEWNDVCAVGPLLDLLQDEKNSRERLMGQNESLARQYVSIKQRAEQAEAQCQTLRELREYDAVKIARLHRMEWALKWYADPETYICSTPLELSDEEEEMGIVQHLTSPIGLDKGANAKAALEDKP